MFNFERLGRVFSTIDGGKLDGKIVAIAPPDGEQATKSYTEIPLKDGKYQQMPNINASKTSKREILYVTGPSGSGKSTIPSTISNNIRNNIKRMKYGYSQHWLKMRLLIKLNLNELL